ncbi:hypothetical protein [Shewanella aestuarii]
MDPKPKAHADTLVNNARSQEALVAQNMTQQPIATKLPKRLAGLMLVYTFASISGLMAAKTTSDLGVMMCLLSLLMVIAIMGRQKAALYMLRGYSVLQLGFYSFLPVIMYDPDNLVAGPTTVDFGVFQAVVSDWIIFSVLIFIGIIQVWISFGAKVKAWFKPKVNMNILS